MASKAAYWSRQPNFGDQLTRVLLGSLAGIHVRFAKAGSAELFAVGSIAEYIPPGYTGTVLGTGKMHAATVLDLSRARVLALRGPLTAEGSGADCALYGDLGLLLRRVAPPLTGEHPLGVLPHFKDKDLAGRWSKRGNLFIDAEQDPLKVTRAAARCERIVTSSLHGVILADTLGIPVRWEPSPEVYGGGFKFHDYNMGLHGERMPEHEWRTADQATIETRVGDLFTVMVTV